jgi:hypothetical protein
MNLQSTKRITEKDINKLNNAYAKGKVYIRGIIKEQEAIMEAAQKHLKILKGRIEKKGRELEPYTSGKEMDEEYEDKKFSYMKLLHDRSLLENTINMASESVEAAKLNHLGETE